MAIEIKVPSMGESITEVQIGEWKKKEGEFVRKDETLLTIESEKATVEVPAPASGALGKVLKRDGATAQVGDVLATLELGESAESGGGESEAEGVKGVDGAGVKKPVRSGSKKKPRGGKAEKETATERPAVMPAAQRLLDEHGLEAVEVKGSGRDGRLLKEDVLVYLEARKTSDTPEPTPAETGGSGAETWSEASRREEVVPMSPLRRTVARRLVEAQRTMAILTTFNEMDMSAVIGLRSQLRESFQEKHGVKLGFMSFFVRAVVAAFKEVPRLNAEVRDNDIVLHHYCDIGVAIGAGKGLVVPPLRNADRMSFAEIEKTIADLGRRAKENKLKPEELEGGTFTISNGGVYGSMLSTPIINPPQSGILGLHAIEDRPIAVEGQVVIRPMMYAALSYDHRIVDGREAVTFLKAVKDYIESPARMLVEA